MSVVVRMEMPKNNCEMAVEIKGVGDWCPIAARVCDYYSTKKMPDWCPIICQLPEGHGPLVSEKDVRWAIDDIVLEIAERIGHVPMTKNETMEYVNRLPVIVSAENE